MEAQLYYTAPTDEIFEDVKSRAIELWNIIGDDQSYRDEKIGRIKDLTNVSDNVMAIVAMFDINNQRKLAARLLTRSSEAIRARMIDGGTPEEFIPF